MPDGKRGHVTVTATLKGVEASIGRNWKRFTASGYAGRLWGGGYEAGVRGQFTW